MKRIEYLIASQRNEVEFEGLGISATGIVDTANGRIIFSPNLDWRNVDVRSIFEKRIHLPIYVDNDARLSALAETWHGNGKCGQALNLVFVTVNEGIGTGIILNGQLYRGSSGGAGEFGHLSLDQRGPVCNCGNRGCWELYASDRATIQRFLQLSQKYMLSSSDQVSSGLTINDVLDLAKNGDKAALQSIKTTAKYLGLGIANIVNSLNPDLVVIGGEITQAWDTIEPIIYKSLESKVFRQDLTCLRIVPSALEEKPSLIGAVLQALSGKLSVAKVA